MPVEEGVTAEQDGKSGATQGKRAFYQSLTVKNLALFLPVFLLSLAPMSISYWLEIQESRINLLVAEMELVAELSLMKADVKTIFNMVESGLNESPEHEKVTGFLGEIEKKHNLSNAIILSRDGDGRYVVLADGKHLFSAGDPMWFHDRYPQIRQTAEESWISKRVSNTKLFSLSTYEYLQVFKPIEYDGNVVGMLLLNKLAEDIERAILADAIRLTGLSLLLAFMGGVGFWFFSNRMLAPLKRLKDAAIKLGEGDLDEVIPPIHRMDEVGELNESFRKMVDQVTESREVLSHNNEELLQALEKVQVMEYREKNLSRFVPDAVRKTLAEHPEQLDRGKEEKDVTVLFLDIEGSSKLAES
ncbi:MAG: HAMP domain-containing protein, partial [Deltaproteobacteria bacterium]|nr:HAMP domain-containing protein [Deltaproteobacteria bacterium]